MTHRVSFGAAVEAFQMISIDCAPVSIDRKIFEGGMSFSTASASCGEVASFSVVGTSRGDVVVST